MIGLQLKSYNIIVPLNHGDPYYLLPLGTLVLGTEAKTANFLQFLFVFHVAELINQVKDPIKAWSSCLHYVGIPENAPHNLYGKGECCEMRIRGLRYPDETLRPRLVFWVNF